MVVVVICGYPSSGKSILAKKITNHFEKNKKVLCICENEIDNKNEIYTDRKRELKVRSIIKSKVSNAISPYDIVVVDAMNHIKSLRYEIFCLCKEQSTNQVLIMPKCTKAQSILYNSERPIEEQYKDHILETLWDCFEPPDPINRWDRPFCVVEDINNINFEEIENNINNKNIKLKPNPSTKPIIQIADNYLNQVNQITQKITNEICSHILQKRFHLLNDKLHINPNTSHAELQRIRRTFLNYIKTNPVQDEKNKLSDYLS